MAILADRVEEAFVVILTGPVESVSGSIGLYTGKSSADQLYPCVVCVAQGKTGQEAGEEDPVHSGNFWIDAQIIIKHSSAPNPDGAVPPPPDPKIEDQAIVDAVSSAVMVDNLADLLSNAVSGLTVFPGGVIFQSPEQGTDSKGHWIDTLRIRLYCCGSSIAA